ncbi:tetratricopeptide (TPR) repeat protein [Desulfobaculum xiamenense]|uniref:Tetratricopeptide (TPR) repeat protein n=1 Tax=Desulfobaculum xiamenense TaxID=995050 RepID=A0A846QEH5_9BACT|nr:tetratricopeptide repeat protein [Desulfobaculum xiamenense]NJB66681.1 tetratricopeptide (TPR) repeat protein [Desulfobaculum xiamenense]
MRVFLITMMVCLVCVGQAMADWSRPLAPAAGRILHEAQQLMQRGETERAGRILAGYVEGRERPHPLGSLIYGNWLMEARRVDDAAAVYEAALADEPGSADILMNLGVARYRQKRFAEAGELFLRAADQSDRPRLGLRHQAAACLFQGGDAARAVDVLAPLVDLPGAKAPWVRLMVHCLVQLERWDRAEGVLLRFLRMHPDDACYWKLLANVRSERQRYRQAAAALEIAYRLKPPTQKERETLSQLYMYVGAPLMAARALEGAFSDAPSPELCDRMARAYLCAGRRNEALRMLDVGLRQKPCGRRWLEKGRILYAARRYDAAADALTRAAVHGERSGQAHYLLGLVEWERRNWDAARENFRIAANTGRFREQATRALASLETLAQTQG